MQLISVSMENPVCDCLRVNNSTLPPIVHRFQDMAVIDPIFAVNMVGCLSNALRRVILQSQDCQMWPQETTNIPL